MDHHNRIVDKQVCEADSTTASGPKVLEAVSELDVSGVRFQIAAGSGPPSDVDVELSRFVRFLLEQGSDVSFAEGVTAFLLQNGVRSLTFTNHGNNSFNISFVRDESNNTIPLDPSLNILGE